MIVGLKIEVEPSLRHLTGVQRRLNDPRPVLRTKVYAAALKMLKGWFDSRGRGKWPPLRPSTIREKARLGFGGKPPMRRTDRLYRAVTRRGGEQRVLVTRKGLEIRVTVPYAQFHARSRPVVPPPDQVPRTFFAEVRAALKGYVLRGVS